jgi:pilus assembly protein CpaE
MTQKLKVLLASRSAEALKILGEGLANAPDIACSTRLIGNGHTDPLFGLRRSPDVLVLRFDAESLAELATLAESSPDSRPPLIVVGPAGNADAMRLAVRSGARDFLAEPVDPDELIAVLESLRAEPRRGAVEPQRAEVTVVIGAAGGVGTSFIACNLACALATSTGTPTLLMDLDINAAPLASFLDVAPERGLLSALAEVEFLDEHALQGYVTKHRSGLHLMGAPSRTIVSAKDIDAARFATLMGILQSNYRHIVADASHALDDLGVTALGMASTVVLVVQQSVVQLRQAARLLRTLYSEVGIPDDRIRVVVNRHLKRSTVALEDIRRTLAREHLTVLPNHYQAVLASIDGGVPLLDLDRFSPVAKAIIELQREIGGAPRAERPSLLRRALPMFSGD